MLLNRRGLMIAATQVPAAGGGGGGFTIGSLSPTIWVDPSDTTTIFTDAGVTQVTADGQAAQRANNKGSASLNFNQATSGARPLYKTSTGKPSLLFDGTDDVLPSSATFTATDGSGQHWVGLSLMFPTAPSANKVPFSLDDGTGSLVISRCSNGNTPGTYEALSDNAAQSGTSDIAPSATASGASVTLIYTITTSGIELYIDGASDGAVALTGSRATGAVKAFLGAYVGVVNFANYHLFQMVSGTGTLTGTQIANLHTALAALHP